MLPEETDALTVSKVIPIIRPFISPAPIPMDGYCTCESGVEQTIEVVVEVFPCLAHLRETALAKTKKVFVPRIFVLEVWESLFPLHPSRWMGTAPAKLRKFRQVFGNKFFPTP